MLSNSQGGVPQGWACQPTGATRLITRAQYDLEHIASLGRTRAVIVPCLPPWYCDSHKAILRRCGCWTGRLPAAVACLVRSNTEPSSHRRNSQALPTCSVLRVTYQSRLRQGASLGSHDGRLRTWGMSRRQAPIHHTVTKGNALHSKERLVSGPKVQPSASGRVKCPTASPRPRPTYPHHDGNGIERLTKDENRAHASSRSPDHVKLNRLFLAAACRGNKVSPVRSGQGRGWGRHGEGGEDGDMEEPTVVASAILARGGAAAVSLHIGGVD